MDEQVRRLIVFFFCPFKKYLSTDNGDYKVKTQNHFTRRRKETQSSKDVLAP